MSLPKRPNHVKYCILGLLAGLLFAGCATTNTINSRRQERQAAYQALSPELKSLVDAGQLKAGMNMDAVYIAWGPANQTTRGGNAAGETITWLYTGGYVQETRYWGRSQVHYDYDPRTFIRARVVFVNGVVQQWQTYPEPVY